jgi:fatty-acyl-CoA synthase
LRCHCTCRGCNCINRFSIFASGGFCRLGEAASEGRTKNDGRCGEVPRGDDARQQITKLCEARHADVCHNASDGANPEDLNVDLGSQLGNRSVATWARALGNIASLDRNSDSTLPRLLDSIAETRGAHKALESESESVSYAALAQRKNQYAQWAVQQGVKAGDIVCLLMPNCPDYLMMWLGITQVGGVVALINTNLNGVALCQAITTSQPCHVVVSAEYVQHVAALRGQLADEIRFWRHGTEAPCETGWCHLDRERYSANSPDASERPPVLARDTALLIFTSGTTGLPKAARVSHYRVLEWSFWFAGMMDTGPSDRLYNCLPMYHSTGGVAALGAVLVKGGTVVVRERFSTSRFWADIAQQSCTLFLYIGELCRYLVVAPTEAAERQHRLRLCCGNGLRGDIWEAFQARFHIPQILEFYASTEGNVALYNCEGRPGAIGRVPSFLAHRFPVALIACDEDTGEPVRGQDGHCIRCAVGDVGEAIGRIVVADDAGPRLFEGYTDANATDKKVLRDVFAPGDAWFRTGDLMRRDKAGFFYFVDRIGDTYRWKGENVSTTQVAEAICRCPGVTGAVVYGVAVPGAEGRAGMAAITTDADFALPRLRAALVEQLPSYARPVFLRICAALETTGTFKPVKGRLMREGFAPGAGPDELYVDDSAAGEFRPIDDAVYKGICEGTVRL